MSDAEQVAPSVPRRSGASGSEKRQRGKAISVRLLPDEDTALRAKAEASGLSLGAYLRACSVGQPGPRAQRSPPVNAVLLGQAVAQLNKAGSNLNQIAHAMNADRLAGRMPSAAVSLETLGEVRAAVAEIRAAVGRRGRE